MTRGFSPNLNPLVEKQRQNEGLRLFSAEGNKRGISCGL
jgi:hypothetical protein